MNAAAAPSPEPSYNINFQTSMIVDLPADRFDLPNWLVNFSSEDYIACTPASGSHKHSTVYRDADGDLVFRNDEWVGGFMMTQFYRSVMAEPNHIRLVSMTRARFLHIWPIIFPLYWDLTVEPYGENRTLFTCKIGAKLSLIYFIASKFSRLLFWSQAHADEETPYFADFAAKWATRGDDDQKSSYVHPLSF